MTEERNYGLEASRGAIKQIMKVRRLRAINLKNWYNYLNVEAPDALKNVHSIKLDVMSGYIDFFGAGKNGRCGDKIQDASYEAYVEAFKEVSGILNSEKDIPHKLRRDILVSVYR
jgi:hypothetical protein